VLKHFSNKKFENKFIIVQIWGINMKNKNKFTLIILGLVFSVMFLAIAPPEALAASSKTVSTKIIETRITKDESAVWPQIYGDKLVWDDLRTWNHSICVYNLSTSKKIKINTSGLAGSPKIYDKKVVWHEKRNKNYDVFMYDLSTLKETQITANETYQWFPSLYGNFIVWMDSRDGIWELYGYKTSSPKELQITNKGLAANPNIYGDKIVWEEWNASKPDICMCNLSTRQITQITSSGSAERPAIFADKIVWHDKRHSTVPDIYMYDILTKKETRITNSGMAQWPAIYGSRIVWMDYRYGNWDIYMYDLSTHKETRITSNKSNQIYPAIYEDRIVWVDERHGKYDIYMGTLISSPTAAFSATPLSGKAPLTIKFTDKSEGKATSWFWNFGDKTTSKTKNPLHKYTKPGKYSISLTVKNTAGSDTISKSKYITVK
jgi:beta propeller repeat protein